MEKIKGYIGLVAGPKRMEFAALPGAVLARFTSDSLFRNSVYLMLSSAVMAVFGFIFWIITARAYTPAQIGFATALISATVLLSNFSMLELDTGLVRYLSKSSRRNPLISTVMIAVAVATLLVAGIYLLGIHHFAPAFGDLTSSPSYAALFLLFMVMVSLNTLTDSVFIAYRAAKYNLIVYTFFGITKIILPLLLVGLGQYGVFFAYTGSVIVSLLLSLFLMRRVFKFRFHWIIEKATAAKLVRFSLGNYIASCMMTLPALIMPTIIVSRLGAEESAYYYMAGTIANMLYIIPSATTSSLLAESSHDEDQIHAFVKNASKLIAALLLPAVAFLVLFDNFILSIFGAVYAEHSAQLLRIMAVTGIFLAISMICETILKVRHRLKTLIAINGLYLAVTMSLAFALLDHGVVGAGLALLLGQVFLCLEHLVVLKWRPAAPAIARQP